MKGDGDSADKHLEFYDEYLSVLDLTEEFYLQTIDIVFQQYLLPKGELVHRGRPVQPEHDHRHRPDDGRGRERRHLRHRPDPGGARPVLGPARDDRRKTTSSRAWATTGSFNGRRFREEIYPRVRAFILKNDPNFQELSSSLGD